MPVHTYSNWNSRPADNEAQIEPYRKYFFICEGANTETYYFRHLIDLRKQLNIHPLIDIRLWEKTEPDTNLSFPKALAEFAQKQKEELQDEFDPSRDKMIVVFDADIFEDKVQGYDELITSIEENDIAAVTNPNFELFLLLHIPESYSKYIQGNEKKFLTRDEKNRFSYAGKLLTSIIGMNAKKNAKIGNLADNVLTAIEQEKSINQDIHNARGRVTSNIGLVLSRIIHDEPDTE